MDIDETTVAGDYIKMPMFSKEMEWLQCSALL